jgi:hypothetical protein
MEKKYEELTEAEKLIRILVFAIEGKDDVNKNFPGTPIGEAYLKSKLNQAKQFMIDNGIPFTSKN